MHFLWQYFEDISKLLLLVTHKELRFEHKCIYSALNAKKNRQYYAISSNSFSAYLYDHLLTLFYYSQFQYVTCVLLD